MNHDAQQIRAPAETSGDGRIGKVDGRSRDPLTIGLVLAATAGLTTPIPAPEPTPTTTGPAGDTTSAPPLTPGTAPTAAGEAGGSPAVAFDGESGGLQGASAAANATVVQAAAKQGAGGLRLAATEAAAYARWGSTVVDRGRTHATTRLWVRVLSRGAGQSVDLFTVGNALQSANFDFFVNGLTRRFQWDLWREDTDQTEFVVEYGRWYLVEAQVEFAGTQHTAAVRIDGASQGTIASTGTSTSVRMLTLGTTGAKTHVQEYDDIEMRLDDGPMGWLADTPPTVGIVRPVNHGTYFRGQSLFADYACLAGDHTVVHCSGPVIDGAAIDTSTLGPRSFTVTARDGAGYTVTRTHRYTVVDGTDPTVSITTPAAPGTGNTYSQGEAVIADFRCVDDPAGSGLAPGDGCVGPVPAGTPIDTTTLGAQRFAVTATDNAGNATTVTATYTVVPNRPDAHIRRSTATRFAGDGIYSPTGAGQTRIARIGPRGAAVFFVRVQNDGEARNRFRVRGPRSDRRWTVRYFDGARNVTRAVTTGTHAVRDLPPGGTGLLRVVVRPTSRAHRGEGRRVAVTVSAPTRPGVRDTVRAVIRRR